MLLSIIQKLISRAGLLERRIAFPEPQDPRVLKAAASLAREGVVQPVLVGACPDGLPEGVTAVRPEENPCLEEYAEIYHDQCRHGEISREEARRAALDPVVHAALMIRKGEVDGSVAGACHTTAHTLRAALKVIGPQEGIRTVSSFFLMVHHDTCWGHDGAFIFADCGMVQSPSVDELAEIALLSARSATQLLGCVPRVAMLSHSTRGSADHPAIRRVREATSMVRERRPDLCIDGEIQVDAAIVPLIARQKAPGSPLEGRANVLIFPDLDAANIAYKLVERLASTRALGPLTQGLKQPANDLSRGCSVEDIHDVAAITAVQSQTGAS
ncbi:MAG: phosphate acetyltransferase [Acidobacteriota bacterium]